MYRAEFQLVGKMPLLMHWDNIEGGDMLKEWRQAPENKNQSVPGDDRSPPWTWQTYLYHDGEHVAMPQDNVMASLMYGGTQVILKKQKTYKELSQSGIVMDTEFLDFTFDGGKRLAIADVKAIEDLSFREQCKAAAKMGFTLHMKRAKVGTSKHVRVRPRFTNWEVSGALTVTSNDLPFDKLEAIFGYAGRAGLCDWRPSAPKRPGPYGMYEASIEKIG